MTGGIGKHMRQLLLAIVLILVPVGLFWAAEHWLQSSSPDRAAVDPGPSLGDLTPFQSIAADVQTLARTDLAAAKTRIGDLETAWDEAEPTLQPLNPAQWGVLDALIDDSLASVRAAAPKASVVQMALFALQDELAYPGTAAPPLGTLVTVQGIAVTDGAGHPLPCESMIQSLRSALPGVALSDSDKAKLADLQAKALERCNADDDQHANAFSAAALALLAP